MRSKRLTVGAFIAAIPLGMLAADPVINSADLLWIVAVGVYIFGAVR